MALHEIETQRRHGVYIGSESVGQVDQDGGRKACAADHRTALRARCAAHGVRRAQHRLERSPASAAWIAYWCRPGAPIPAPWSSEDENRTRLTN